ncbi:hypothetical protein CCH79_00016986, partial [Gambusia affinis]
LIPEVSSLSWFTTIVPLVLVLVITAIKDATDDYFRHKSDRQVNNRQSQVLIRGRYFCQIPSTILNKIRKQTH